MLQEITNFPSISICCH